MPEFATPEGLTIGYNPQQDRIGQLQPPAYNRKDTYFNLLPSNSTTCLRDAWRPHAEPLRRHSAPGVWRPLQTPPSVNIVITFYEPNCYNFRVPRKHHCYRHRKYLLFPMATRNDARNHAFAWRVTCGKSRTEVSLFSAE